MPRRPKTMGIESFDDLQKKLEVLEREMAQQRAALEKLKSLASRPVVSPEPRPVLPLVRKSA